MLRKESTQKDFFDSYVYERLLPKKHLLLDIKEQIDFSFVDEEVKPFYSDNTCGRPAFAPAIIFKMLFLEYQYNLSDYGVVEQVKTNILFRYFVGLGISDDTPDDTTLVKFRQRLGEAGFKKLFDKIVKQANQKDLIKGKLKVLDATHIQADAALQGAVNLLRGGRRMVVNKVLKTDPYQAQQLKEKFVTNERTFTKPSEDEITQELAMTRDFIKETKNKFNPDTEELIELLETALNQQQRKANDPNHKEPDEIASSSDKDARYGHKSDKKKFLGYKAHISLDEESGIVTSARTIIGNRNEGAHEEVKQLLEEDKDKGIKQEAVTADSLYDSYENRNRIHAQQMRAFIPSRTRNRKKRPYLENFIYDPQKDTLICPQGYSPISKTNQEQGTLYIFSTTKCRNCPSIHKCPKPNNDRVRIFVSNDYRLKLVDNIPDRKEALIKRKSIERKFGQTKKWHGLARARYRQRWRVAIQTLMTFSVVNIKRIVTLSPPASEYALCRGGFG